LRKFTAYVVLAGLVNAAIAAFLFFRLPADHTPSFRSLLIRAVFYVAFSVLAGAGGARFYWNRFSIPFTTDPPLSFQLFVLVNASAWVWVPAAVLLSRQDSPVSSVLSALGAALLANGLRRIIPFEAGSRDLRAPTARWESGELFAATLYTPPRETHGYVIALCIYATGYFLVNHFYLNAGAPFAAAAFLFAWKRTLVQQPTESNETRSRAALRLAVVSAAAVLVTLLAMLYGIGHRNRVEAVLAAAIGRGGGAAESNQLQHGVYVTGASGYQSIILWPALEKPQILAPVLANISPFAARAAKPLVIKFDGPYWYFQPPGQRPGPQAHEGRGNPLSVNIEANNFVPLNMEAVQNLVSPIPLARCGEVQVTIQNRDNLRGVIALGVELTDSSAPNKPPVSLGQRTISSSQPDQFVVKLTPVDEVLRFTVPSHAALRKFDQITVQYFPGQEHWQVGAKVAIEQFELIPR
jgi:hypothetical protein